MRAAYPPTKPAKEASTPADLFPEIHQIFLGNEHHRMARFIEHSAGCVDLRDVTGVKLVVETSNAASMDTRSLADGSDRQRHGKMLDRSFEVVLSHGGPTVFEAYSPEDAKEWVDKLNDLKAYWNRRHRVEWVESYLTLLVSAEYLSALDCGWMLWLYTPRKTPSPEAISVTRTRIC